MNIKEAKDQIQSAMKAYFTKDLYGNYVIPIERQRPVFLIGPPGIGKTAIMEQVAAELEVGLVSYSMTHHTRQSALGLPFIEEKSYGGKKYNISEYTMSEIIASVYEMIEQTGISEGILFLDEINCVSETLAPAMLQFLQYKIFGRHSVPDGWIVVTAGNPPEYNNSVREFDIVTWDRLKRIDVEPDYQVWKEYAYKKNIHPSISTYLDIKKNDFYVIETTVDGKTLVTARGWSDLSDMIHLYEHHKIDVKETLIVQYLQNPKIAKEFAAYYDLFNKYKSDYQINKILNGTVSEEIKIRAQKASFDEKLSILGLLIDGSVSKLREVYKIEQVNIELFKSLKEVKKDLKKTDNNSKKALLSQVNLLNKRIEIGKLSSMLSSDEYLAINGAIKELENIYKLVVYKKPTNNSAAFAIIKQEYELLTKKMQDEADKGLKLLSNMFKFSEEVFLEGQEMLILVTELTINPYSAHFISRYGCKEYFAHNKELLFYERQQEIIQELEVLGLELK